LVQKAPLILIADNSAQDLRIHASTLEREGFRITAVATAERVLAIAQDTVPDLFLLATGLTDMDGYALCERLKKDPRLTDVPVVFVTESRLPQDIDRGYTAGGVDYIVKPCPLSEFLARVKTHVRLHRLLLEVHRLREIAIDSSPLTHLPGNNAIVATIQDAVDNDEDVCVIYCDLDNFKAYNDYYGFSEGDEVLLFTAEALQTALRTVCGGKGFLGHIGGDDFVAVVDSVRAVAFGAQITRWFDERIPAFYSLEDAERGSIHAKNRRGRVVEFPLVALSMGGVHLKGRGFTRYLEVVSICAEVKKAAKRVAGTNLLLSRRLPDLPHTAKRDGRLRSKIESAAASVKRGSGLG